MVNGFLAVSNRLAILIRALLSLELNANPKSERISFQFKPEKPLDGSSPLVFHAFPKSKKKIYITSSKNGIPDENNFGSILLILLAYQPLQKAFDRILSGNLID